MKRSFLLLITFMAVLAAWCVPANRRPFVFRQPDGTCLTVTLHGDEYFHYYLTAQGDTLTEGTDGWLVPYDGHASTARRGLARAKRQADFGLGAYPTLGSPRELVLLVEYPDCRFTYDATTFRRMLCEEGYSDDGATGSAFDYFCDQSSRLFTPDIEVVGPIMLPHPRAYYGSPTANMYDGQPWLMLTDAAPQVDDVVDFSRFDNDHDGFVDNVFIFYAGKGQNDGGPLEAVWPHAANIWTYYALDCTLDGVRLGSYACTNEITGADRLTGIGTFCHEYSHVLGLPDLYSTTDAAACFSPGAFELMDSGSYNNEGRTPPNMSAYDRACLQWLNPEPLSGPETVVLYPDTRGEGTAARLITTVKDTEYYLLENRQRTGWDAYLPGHGMLVWHIDYDAAAWTKNQVNVLPGHQRVDLIEADGVLTKETQDGDPFPGARQTTSLNLLPWTGISLDAPITDIRETEDGTISFRFRGGGSRIDAPVALDATDIGPTFCTAHWQTVPGVFSYEISLWYGNAIVPALTVMAHEGNGAVLKDGVWSFMLTGLEPQRECHYAVVAIDGERRSAASNDIHLTTLPPTFDMLAPTGLQVVGTTTLTAADGTLLPACTLQWHMMEGAANYEVEVFSQRLAKPTIITLDFTGGIAALPDGWTTTSTQTSGVAGTFGAARPALMLQPGEWLQSPVFPEAISDFTFWTKGGMIEPELLAPSFSAMRFTNIGTEVAYLDDVVIETGNQYEYFDTDLYPAATHSLSVPYAHVGTQDQAPDAPSCSTETHPRFARVRGIAPDGTPSRWSAPIALPSPDGITAPRISPTTPTTDYLIPPFIHIRDGRKAIGK